MPAADQVLVRAAEKPSRGTRLGREGRGGASRVPLLGLLCCSHQNLLGGRHFRKGQNKAEIPNRIMRWKYKLAG
ncbi:hypothetical protein RchiOBHm_Chr7g0190001 [Rosa chinensis]|uniref:Uncharacterized protein n=1 Tax=Rosa chinensis TaxID=74649 RepID=A0A2P6P4W5_ROSCH|nr:hypothetical protein RchiOBHm_Chr7g0190001 [Rosa chinensis]